MTSIDHYIMQFKVYIYIYISRKPADGQGLRYEERTKCVKGGVGRVVASEVANFGEVNPEPGGGERKKETATW